MKLANNMTFENLIQSYEEMYDCKYDNLQLKELRYGFKQGLFNMCVCTYLLNMLL